MKDSVGSPHPCPALKSLSNKVGSLLCFWNAPKKYRRLDAKLETKMIELKKSSSGQSNFRSINSIILKFPQLKEGLKEIKGVFEQFDSNGTIDREELKKCVKKLQFHVKEEEIDDLFHSCDVDEKEGIQFNEFIVLLCLIYILMDSSPPSSDNTSKIGSPELEATFNTIVEAFLFLDKSGDGKLHKKDVVKALNEASPCEKSPSHVTQTRFKEMDWDRSGDVSFRQFLFAFLDWVGIDTDDENHTLKRRRSAQG
ncbi:probable calcium-binding protein CML22 isoform X2 [Lycium ferocissimum]|uniref:probable calcium-binding protein CML22 isoform X2 n=1 Tax=Lycium ferocissimum TaxID=112874 RepID=UPI0028152022|nr:probable calcium-binding protein CML22 isoform X2 [Lycium ferocissimum]